jgi:hypothetical protein
MNRPHSKYPHVFVVLRIDTHQGIDDDFDTDRLAVTSVFSSQDAAEADAARLNGLSRSRGSRSRYVTLVGRLKRG